MSGKQKTLPCSPTWRPLHQSAVSIKSSGHVNMVVAQTPSEFSPPHFAKRRSRFRKLASNAPEAGLSQAGFGFHRPAAALIKVLHDEMHPDAIGRAPAA